MAGFGNQLRFLTMVNTVTSVNSNSALSLDGPTEQAAARFQASDTSEIDSIDCAFVVTGTVTGHTYTLEIQADNGSGLPSGTPLGAATSAFAGPASNGFVVGDVSLGSPTGALVLNASYWIVLKVASGTPDASNNLNFRLASSNSVFATNSTTYPGMRHFNGTNWTTTSPEIDIGNFALNMYFDCDPEHINFRGVLDKDAKAETIAEEEEAEAVISEDKRNIF